MCDKTSWYWDPSGVVGKLRKVPNVQPSRSVKGATSLTLSKLYVKSGGSDIHSRDARGKRKNNNDKNKTL